jgi:hypothetical protein
MKEMAESGEYDRRVAELSPGARAMLERTLPIFLAVSFTTPLVALSIWSAIVLERMPESAHVRTPAPIQRSDIRQAVELAKRIERAAATDFATWRFVHAA